LNKLDDRRIPSLNSHVSRRRGVTSVRHDIARSRQITNHATLTLNELSYLLINQLEHRRNHHPRTPQ